MYTQHSSPSIALIKHTFKSLITNTLKSGQPLFSGQIVCPQLTLHIKPSEKQTPHYTHTADTDQAQMVSKLPLRMDKCNPY